MRLVDPRLLGQRRRDGPAAEPLGVGGIGFSQDLSALLLDLPCGAEVDGRGCVQPDPGMAMLVIVILEEFSGILDGTKPARERRTIFK
ncbi:hypothetical protein ACIBI7_54565 [Nonomuraea fuscirosea]|uniref:hypothetical protein n=1 Tax=Nonomuraea fuscirosea TaxID=1291556 RepID=UPI0037B17128